MKFEPNEDQRAFLDAVGKVVERHLGTHLEPRRFEYSTELEHALEEAGFFGAMDIPELGATAAAAMVMELTRLPLCAEIGLSALVGPAACAQLPRPYALLGDDDATPARFLPQARTVLRIRGDGVEAAALAPDDVEPLESVFAYPMGRLRRPAALAWKRLAGISAARVRDLWRVAVAAEATGCLAAGLAAVLEHVKDRRQFNRPLGSFQAMQHRLADCAVQVEAAKWLALRAADSGLSEDAATAAGYAQEITRKVSYDLHQFMGAMGLTLEHPLHRWTYRARLLRSELGSAERQFSAAAVAAWGVTE